MTLKALTKTRQQKSAVIEDSRGNILTQNTAALNRWAEYCSGPYNYKLHPDTHHHHHQQHHHHHLSLNREGRWGTTDDFATSFLHFISVLHCPLRLGDLQACPFPNVVLPPLPLSALSSSSFH